MRRTLICLAGLCALAFATASLAAKPKAPAKTPGKELRIVSDIEKRVAQFSPTPLHADLSGLYIDAGGAECLLDDAVRLARRAEAAEVDVTLSVVDGMQHVFPFLAGHAPEADAEIAAIAAWYGA